MKKAFEEFMMVIHDANRLYDNIIADRRKTYKHPQVDFFIDHFLKLAITNKSDEDKAQQVVESDIRSVGIDMFGGGITTTNKTLQMMLAVLVNNPGIQDDIYREIVEMIGARKPCLEDRFSMPFTEAVLLETLRYHSLGKL